MSYQQRIDKGALRLMNLGCLDIKGEHYGSFDRLYWHLRQRDFASSSAQMATLPLLRSQFAHNEQVRDFLHASLQYLEKIQHHDGSFDEWYPNERGWGGPTSYVLDFAARTYLEFQDKLPPHVRESLVRVIKKASNFTVKHWEKDVLFNHVALSVLALEAVHKIDSSFIGSRELSHASDWLEAHFVQGEGWGKEYGYADPGYQTATLSFLAKAHQLSPKKLYEDLCLESLEFIKYFHYPDGSYGLGIGARETNCVFDFGAHYWSSRNETAQTLARALSERKCGLDEESLDDHYFIYRMLELSDCVSFKCPEQAQVPYSLNFEGVKNIEKAGFLIVGSAEKYTVVNLEKGGALIEFSKKDCELSQVNYGVMVKNEQELASSFVCGHTAVIELSDRGVSLEAQLAHIPAQTFSVAKSLLFRLIMLTFGQSARGAYFIKHIVRRLLTTKNRKSHYLLKRRINFHENEISAISDELVGKSGNESIYTNGFLENRYVPQSKYHGPQKIKFLPLKKRV